MPTAEEWRERGTRAIQVLLSAEGAATQPGMEAELADRKFAGASHKIDPHHLTTARNQLLDGGVIERLYETTRGGQVVTTYLLANPTKLALRQAGRKRLLHARYMSWSSYENKWGAAPIPVALERVVHASLFGASAHGYRLLRPEGGGEVGLIAGEPVQGAVSITRRSIQV